MGTVGLTAKAEKFSWQVSSVKMLRFALAVLLGAVHLSHAELHPEWPTAPPAPLSSDEHLVVPTVEPTVLPTALQLPKCKCPKNWAPVCSADGKMYPNACYAECKGAEIACKLRRKGECPCRKPCPIPKIWKPVCGKDGRYYANKKAASCQGVEVECEGLCPCNCDCKRYMENGKGPVPGMPWYKENGKGPFIEDPCFWKCNNAFWLIPRPRPKPRTTA